MLQMKSAKVAGEEDVDKVDLEDAEEMALEGDEEADAEDEDENDSSEEALTDDDDDTVEGDGEYGFLNESMSWPVGPLSQADKYCKRGRQTSCSSPRGWLTAGLTLAKCSDKCTNSRTCKFFFYNADSEHCGICSKCDARMASQKNQEGYSVYKKWVLTFPFKGLCKERHSSEKSLKKAKGCKKRAKKTGAVAYAYKSKKCRTWKKCSQNKKGNWQVKKAPR